MMEPDNNYNNNYSEPYYTKQGEDDSIYTTTTNPNHPTPSVYSSTSNTDKMNNFGDQNKYDDENYNDYDSKYDENNNNNNNDFERKYDDDSGYYQPQQSQSQPTPGYDTDYYYNDDEEDNDNNIHPNQNRNDDRTQQYRRDDHDGYDDYNNDNVDEQDALFRSGNNNNDDDDDDDVNHHSLPPPPSTKRKTTCTQRMIQCCSTCYVPKCQYRGPCHFPHGCCYSVLGIMSAVGGLMMNLYVVGTCLFQRIQLINLVTGDIIPGSQRGYGFLSRETDYGVESDYRQCTWYPQDEYNDIFDGWMKTGRFFAFLSAMLATVCFIVMVMTCCVAFSRSMFEKWLFWMYIAAAILVAFSFFIFGSEFCQENDCKVADGCGWAISAFMFHLLAANTVKSFPLANPPKPKRPNRRNRNNVPNDDDDDDDDDLYYETEEDKYPPKRPEGPRGVKIDKDGVRTFDDGEDYFNDMGEMIDPYDPDGANKKKSRRTDDDEDEDLDDISDHDLEEYASDNEDDDDDDDDNDDYYDDEDRTRKSNKAPKYDANGNPIYDDDEDEVMYNVDVDDATQATRQTSQQQQQQYDMYGNPIYDPDMIAERGNLGVGYDDDDDDINSRNEILYDEYGQPVPQKSKYNDDNIDDPYYPPQKEEIAGYDDFGNTNYNFDRHSISHDTNNDVDVRNNPFDPIPPPPPQQQRKSFSSDDIADDDVYTTTSYPHDDTRSYQSEDTYGSGHTGHNTYYTDDAIHNNNDDDPIHGGNGMATHLGQQGSPMTAEANRRYSNIDDDDDTDSHGPVFA